MAFDALMGRLSPDEQAVVRSVLDLVYPSVRGSLDWPTIRWSCNLLLMSPEVPLAMRAPIEQVIQARRYEQVVEVVVAGLMDSRVRDEIRRRYEHKPWPTLGLFPAEWRYGET